MSEPRTYSVEEARALLPKVGDLLEEVQALARDLPELDSQLAEVRYRREHAAGQSEHQHADADLRELESAKQDQEVRLARAITELTSMEVRVKDVENGLVDFLSYREGELVELCWKLGERDLGYWHRIGEGFAGRHPL